MQGKTLLILAVVLLCAGNMALAFEEGSILELPEVQKDGDMSLERALALRRSVRNFTPTPLEVEHVAQLLWAAQGITCPQRSFRTAPSAGALYPLKVYVAVGDVEGLEQGVYVYDPQEHSLKALLEGDRRENLYRQALHQGPVLEAPAVFIIAARYEILEPRYGGRAQRYAVLEAGHVAQNLCLQAVALQMGSVVIGAFDDGGIHDVLDFSEEEYPLYLIPVGYPDL